MIGEQVSTSLLEAAWRRVQGGPLERERSLGPFDLDSLGGSAALAAADLLACERHAHLQEPPGEHASAETVLATPLAEHAADAASSLIALTRALAYAAGGPAAGGWQHRYERRSAATSTPRASSWAPPRMATRTPLRRWGGSPARSSTTVRRALVRS